MNYNQRVKKLSERFGKPENEFYVRSNGRIEWTCEHGVGHTVFGYSEHGCDGCCKKLEGKMTQTKSDSPRDTPVPDARDIKTRTFKITHFDVFPFEELEKIAKKMAELGYKCEVVNNGNIAFTKTITES